MKTVRLKFVDGVEHYAGFLRRVIEKKYAIEESDSPDFLFYGDDTAEQHRNYRDCVKIYVPIENHYPDFSYCHYALGFHNIRSPRHLYFPYYLNEFNAEDLVKNLNEVDEVIKQKDKFCAFVVSNGNKRRTRSRIQFFEKLNARKHVDSLGKFMNNVGYTLPYESKEVQRCLSFYKFYIAFENHSAPYYTTEKLPKAMLSRAVPIYYGNPRIAEEFNPKSFINVHDFKNFDEAVEYILEVDADDAKYRALQAEPYFYDNKPSVLFSEERLGAFLEKIFEGPAPRLDLLPVKHYLYEWWKKAKPYWGAH